MDRALSMAETFEVRMPCSARTVITTLKRTLLLRPEFRVAASSFSTDSDSRCVKGRVVFRITCHMASGQEDGYLARTGTVNVTGSYISKRRIPDQKLLGAKCLCCDVFAQHRAKWLLRKPPAFSSLQPG